MSTLLSALRMTGAAAVLMAGLAAGPVLAQSGEPSMNFSLGIGNGQSEMNLNQPEGDQPAQGQSYRGGGGNFEGGFDDGDYRRFNLCLTNREVIRGLRDYGFRRVEVTDSSRRRAEVIGRWGRWDYLMRVNKCTGEVNVIDRFRRGMGSGFGLQFNFN